MRWPPPPHEAKYVESHADAVPFRQRVTYTQGRWQNELWMRSLRKPGLVIQDPVYATAGADCKELHEEWRMNPPFTSPRALPFSGSTASGRATLPNEKIPERWVERPVAVGKYALDHMDGGRYKFDLKTPRLYTDETAFKSSSPDARHLETPQSPSPTPGASAGGRKSPGARWRAILCQA